MDGGGVCVGRGDLLSSPQALGQLLRKESRPRRAMKVVLRLRGCSGGRVQPLGGETKLQGWKEG